MLTVDAMTGAYGGIVAVRDLDLAIHEGECVGLLGANGAGKSTTLRLLAGTLGPQRGSILWDGVDITRLPAERRSRLGITLVPEGRGVFSGLTVMDNLKAGAYARRVSGSQLQCDLDEVLDRLPRLRTKTAQLAGSLSGGEQQLLVLGRAFMAKPRLLMVDEPSLGLAPQVVETVYETLRQIAADGVALLLVEQYVDFAAELCERLIVLNKGEMVLEGPPATVVRHGSVVGAYLGGIDPAPVRG